MQRYFPIILFSYQQQYTLYNVIFLIKHAENLVEKNRSFLTLPGELPKGTSQGTSLRETPRGSTKEREITIFFYILKHPDCPIRYHESVGECYFIFLISPIRMKL